MRYDAVSAPKPLARSHSRLPASSASRLARLAREPLERPNHTRSAEVQRRRRDRRVARLNVTRVHRPPPVRRAARLRLTDDALDRLARPLGAPLAGLQRLVARGIVEHHTPPSASTARIDSPSRPITRTPQF